MIKTCKYKAYKSIDVEIDLSDFSTGELLEEMKHREVNPDVHENIKFLEQAGCPNDIIQQLRAWNSHTVTKEDLRKWKEFVEIEHYKEPNITDDKKERIK